MSLVKPLGSASMKPLALHGRTQPMDDNLLAHTTPDRAIFNFPTQTLHFMCGCGEQLTVKIEDLSKTLQEAMMTAVHTHTIEVKQ